MALTKPHEKFIQVLIYAHLIGDVVIEDKCYPYTFLSRIVLLPYKPLNHYNNTIRPKATKEK
jgi:hypothetical protein